jgi:hypothetical protein
MKASAIIKAAANVLDERGAERDQEGERSMARAVEIFNVFGAMNGGMKLTEKEGWIFMICLKMARAERSDNPDHYVDLVGYIALLGEHVLNPIEEKTSEERRKEKIKWLNELLDGSDAICDVDPTDTPFMGTLPDGWIEWNGGREDGPVGVRPDQMVQVKLRDAPNRPPAECEKRWWQWEHSGMAGDIVAYRVVEEEPEDALGPHPAAYFDHTCKNCGHTFPVTPLVKNCPVCRYHHDYQYPL